MLDKLNKTIIDGDELAELVAERDRLQEMCAEAIKSGEKLAAERDRMRAALKFIADRKWAATTIEPAKWVNEFCAVAEEALKG